MYKTIRVSVTACAVVAICGVASAQNQTLIDAGAMVYEENCASCHGEKLRNSGAIIDLKTLRADDRARFNKYVMEGKGQMPAWQGTLNDDELDQLWAYIRAHAN
jgi:cytochrome c oxidase cbb3-type subunit 3